MIEKNSKKRKIVIASCIFLFILILNIPPLNYIVRIIERDNKYYSYSTLDDSTTFFFEHGMDPEELVYFKWKRLGKLTTEKPLYRNFAINPLAFWRWKDYFFDERYTLPYISREDVIANARKKGK